MRVETSGVTRIVIIGRRWAVKIPHLMLFVPNQSNRFGWMVRGWLANRSEWRQRRRTDVARPVLTLGHLIVVFPAATAVGRGDRSGPWDNWDDIPDDRLRDERKPSSWGMFTDGWRIIDYDRSWEANHMGIIGWLYYANQRRLGNNWSKLPPYRGRSVVTDAAGQRITLLDPPAETGGGDAGLLP